MSHAASQKAEYFKVAAALMALLAATVVAARLDLGPWNMPIAMVIAGAKALLVMTFFMHLRGATPLVRIFAAAGFVWLSILIGLSLADYLTRPDDVAAQGRPSVATINH